MDIVAKIEGALSLCEDEGKAETARAAIANVIRNARQPKSNVRKSEWEALASLREDTTRVVLEADKGNATVVMDVVDYDRKVLEIIEKHPFKQLTRDPTRKNERRVNEGLKRLAKNGCISKEMLARLRLPEGSSCAPLIYGRVELHKELRPSS